MSNKHLTAQRRGFSTIRVATLLSFAFLMCCRPTDVVVNDPCNAAHPDGECPFGQICRAGQCLDDDLFCSEARPSGLCPDESQTCLEGICVDEADLCSVENQSGLCPTSLHCINGQCAVDAPCSEDEPRGFCDEGMACVDGSCVMNEELCSEAHPDGPCPLGDVCIDGDCVSSDLTCSPSQPAGLCPTGSHCIDGFCIPEGLELCSEAHPDGWCPEGQLCHEGLCEEDDDACSPTNPEGLCADGLTCVDGECISVEEACSPTNPDGICPEGEDCVDGECLSLVEECSAANPTGSCPDGQSCEGGECMEHGAPPVCADGDLNGLETDVDCGGIICEACLVGRACEVDEDCTSLSCDVVCQAASPSYEIDEDFETGDFTLFGYLFESSLDIMEEEEGHQWEIETDAASCHGGSFCMRSSVYHVTDETTSVSLPLSVREDTTVSFWVKTETEEDEHVFRFLIDEAVQIEISGVNDWTRYSFDVRATGPGGPDRVLTWEYSRSGYVAPDHPPYNTVWIDDIDMPSWNTQPTAPRLLTPGNGMVVVEDRPEFRWRSVDPDFDRIIYEMQYDTDPSFPSPFTTGEVFDLTDTPSAPLENEIMHYWRVRAKDESDYRWSDWSTVSSFRVVTNEEYGRRWRQELASQFAVDELEGAVSISGDAVVGSRSTGSTMVENFTADTGDGTVTVTFTEIPENATSFRVRLDGDIYSYHTSYSCSTSLHGYGYVDVSVDGVALSYIYDSQTSSFTNCSCFLFSSELSVSDEYFVDGEAVVELTPLPDYYSNDWCGTEMTLTLSFETNGGYLTSVPIYLDTFNGLGNWEKLFFEGSGGTTVRVLDGDHEVIDDEYLPGNTEGLPPGTHFLWNLDPEEFPVVYLQAFIPYNGRLEAWELYANDGFKWHFGNPGESEGFEGFDTDATPVVTVDEGVLRLESTLEGTDPRIEYRFPIDVDASRFTELEVRMRTSTAERNDVVTLFWENNYGFFDPVRAYEVEAFFFGFNDALFDLTVVPAEPNQPWQGDISAIRVDPVERFVDAAGLPADGWFEIDYIWLR